jgi:hypothetical protein
LSGHSTCFGLLSFSKKKSSFSGQWVSNYFYVGFNSGRDGIVKVNFLVSLFDYLEQLAAGQFSFLSDRRINTCVGYKEQRFFASK